ncbi:hypothetical protein GCM10023213_14080 [Prosthecobacter algae]|uniref:Uncharacterized protein n=1 Tax=Prosthecobacter algae TaxID=1144682 RepID=A0ABP9NYW3_9BACT
MKFIPDPGAGSAQAGLFYGVNEAHITEAIKLGNVYAANDGNLDASPLGLSQPLTQYVTGIQDEEGLDVLLESIAPSVPVGRRFSYLNETESEAMQKRDLAAITRPIHGEFPILRPTGSQTDGSTDNIGLCMYVDIDQGGLLPAVQQRKVASLRNMIYRSQIADALAKIDAAAVGDTTKNWGDSASDPDSDIDEMIDAGGDAGGEDNNIVVFGHGAFRKRRRAYRQAARLNSNADANALPDELRDLYQVDRVVNIRSRYRTSATATARLLADKVYTYNARPGMTEMDSSHIKRFVTMTESGMLRVFIGVESHRVKIIVDGYQRNTITRALGIRKRAVTYS